MGILCLVLLPLAMAFVSAYVGDIPGNFPSCAQVCAQINLLQYCSQDQTVKCFCSTQPAENMASLYQCVLKNHTLPTCDPASVVNLAVLLCGRDGYNLDPLSIHSTIRSATSSARPSGPSPVFSYGSPSLSSYSVTTAGSNQTNQNTTTSNQTNQNTADRSTSESSSASESGGQGPSQESKRLSGGVIIGITISGVVALGIVAGLIMFIIKHRQPTPAHISQRSQPTSIHPQAQAAAKLPQNYPARASPPQPRSILEEYQAPSEITL